MQRQLLLIALVGIVIIAGVSFAGYYLGKVRESQRPGQASPTPEPSPSPAPEPTPSSTPTATPTPGTGLLPTAPPEPVRSTPKASVQGTETKHISTPAPASAPLRISFVSLPSAVDSGQEFTIEWRVNGPSGAHGEKTTLSASYETSLSSEGSSASSSSSTKQSFGSFTVPKNFRSKLSYGGAPGTIHLRVTATVEGQTISAEGAVQLR